MKNNRIVSLGAILVLCAATTWAADPVGEWKGEGPRGEITVVISKAADASLQGQMITDFGPNDLTDLKLDGNDLSFINRLQFDGGSFALTFTGKIDGDTYTGNISTPRGDSPISLTRADTGGGSDGLIGTWKLTGESQFGPMDHTLVATPDAKITYESDGQVSEATNIKIDSSKISFDVTIYGGGRSYDVAFQGSFDDKALTGDIISNGSSFVTLTAPREYHIFPTTGIWVLTGESRYGQLEHKLTIAPDGNLTYESGGQVSDADNIEFHGNNVTFSMTIFGGGNAYPLSFEGVFTEEGLTGDVISTGGDSFAAVKAPRN